MKVNLLPIDKVKPYEKNPRFNQNAIEKVARSIDRFGFRQPIVTDGNHIVIVGHTRLLAAQKLGLKEVPVHVAENLTAQEIKAYRIADNRVHQESSWDNILLADELKDLQLDDFDLSLTGFDSDELDDLLNPEKIEEEEPDFTDGVAQKIITKPGDVWILGKHRLMCGDSTNPLDVERLLNNHKPNLMVTDPPYGVEYDPQWRNETSIESVGKKDDRSVGKIENDDKNDWADAYSLFTGNVAYIWHASLFTDVVAKNLKDCGFEIISQIIWAKQHFAISRGDYHWQHEPCWYAVREGETHNWQGARDQSTLWEIANNNSFGNANKEETFGHGTQKPIECMMRPILNNSARGDYVYDPFGGSGTTLIAAERSQRKCLMMELEPKYCDMIVRRWQKEVLKSAKLEGTDKSFSDLENE